MVVVGVVGVGQVQDAVGLAVRIPHLITHKPDDTVASIFHDVLERDAHLPDGFVSEAEDGDALVAQIEMKEEVIGAMAATQIESQLVVPFGVAVSLGVRTSPLALRLPFLHLLAWIIAGDRHHRVN